jgi:hypothetical protein
MEVGAVMLREMDGTGSLLYLVTVILAAQLSQSAQDRGGTSI